MALLCAILMACREDTAANRDAALEEARNLMDDQRYEEALETMRELVESDSDDPKIQTLYGEALLASGQPSLAVWPLSRAMRDPDQLVEAGLLLATAQLAAGSGGDARRTATRILEADPANEDALLVRINASLGESLEKKALEDLDRIEKIAGRTPETDFLRLDALLGLGRETEAEKLLKELKAQADEMREEVPEEAARLCAAIATFTFERGDVPGAKARFSDCLDGNGYLNPLLFIKAVEFFDEHNESARSTELYKRRFEHDPTVLPARVQYADRLQKVGRFKDAEALLLEATAKQEATWSALVDLYAREGNLEKSLECLDKAIAASPNRHDEWFFARADLQLELGRIEEAEKTLKSIEVPAHRALIQAHIASLRGDLDEAAKQYEEGIRLWPDNPDARYLAGQLYERKGDWKRASAHYREAARMDEPHYESSMALAGLQRALGDNEGVGFLLSRIAESHPRDPKVFEMLIEHAVDIHSEQLGMNMLRQLSRIPGQASHAVVLASERAKLAEGPEAALKVIDESQLDVADPAHVELLEARCRLLVELDRSKEAFALIEQGRKTQPESPRLLVLRAFVHHDHGDLDAEVADLEAARKLDARFLPALIELAGVKQSSGDLAEARRLYEEADQIDSLDRKKDRLAGFGPAIALARIDLKEGKTSEARARLRQVLAGNPRHGEAAWMLLQTYVDDPAGLGRAERADLALRAGVFLKTPAAQDYLKRLNADRTDGA